MSIHTLLQKESYTVDDLREITEILRSEHGCPWDREQTHQSIRSELLEETYEAAEGIDSGDNTVLCEELGDVLLQVVFHARIAEEEGAFDLNDVADGICKKMILRHPHVFGTAHAETSEQVLQNWDEIKKVEKQQKSATDSLRAVSKALPSLMRSQKLAKKAAKVGFTYADTTEALNKVEEEYAEIRKAICDGNAEAIAEEFGDLLFAVANAARLAGVDAEEALTRADEKFLSRFEKIERASLAEGKELCEQDVNKLLLLWETAKKS